MLIDLLNNIAFSPLLHNKHTLASPLRISQTLLKFLRDYDISRLHIFAGEADLIARAKLKENLY